MTVGKLYNMLSRSFQAKNEIIMQLFLVPTSVYNVTIFFDTITLYLLNCLLKFTLKYIYNMFRPH
jgi:hypothetical protein